VTVSAADVGGSPKGPTHPVVVLDGVSVFYGEVVGLSNVSLSLGPGITGIVGPNGSGKTTMMRTLTGLISPVEGSVRVFGGEPFLDADVRARISLVPAGSSFYDNLTARRNLEVAFLAKGQPRAEARDRASQALEMVRLTADGDRRYGVLSRGMRQRVKLGLTLASDDGLVLLDEPFLGVDPPNRRNIRDIIFGLGEAGRTVLISSHVLHEVESLTDRVGVLAHGRLLGFGRIQTLLRELRDRHPHRIQLQVDEPRVLAQTLMGLSHVQELKIDGERHLEFVTDHPEVAYREVARAVVASGAVVRRVETLDNTLEAVFAHVTSVGTHRL
jgi:ABC-2 type transport system ATP-binding protein